MITGLTIALCTSGAGREGGRAVRAGDRSADAPPALGGWQGQFSVNGQTTEVNNAPCVRDKSLGE